MILWLTGLLACWSNGRNHPNSGNPSMEALLHQCDVEGWTVRLYQGQPDATVAFWSSVTVAGHGLDEKQVLYAYGTPLYEQLACTDAGAVLTGAGEPPRTLPVTQLQGLRTKPLRFWKGRPED